MAMRAPPTSVGALCTMKRACTIKKEQMIMKRAKRKGMPQVVSTFVG